MEEKILVFGTLCIIGLVTFFVLTKILNSFIPRLLSRGNEVVSKMISSVIAWVMILLYSVYLGILVEQLLPLPKSTKSLVFKVFLSGYVILGAIIITKIASSLILPSISERINRISGSGEVSFSVSIFSSIIGVILISVGVGVILAIWNVSLIPLITTLGIGGLAVAIALQDTLSNFFAGIQVLLVHQIRVGDYIKLENTDEGVVVDINWRNTTIRDLYNNLIIIPNSKLISSITKNFYLPEQEMSIVVPVEVSIENDLKKVEEVTLSVAEEVQKTLEGAVKTWQPLVRYQAFSDYSVKFNVILRIAEYTHQFSVKHEFLKRLHLKYREEGIKLAVPLMNIKSVDIENLR